MITPTRRTVLLAAGVAPIAFAVGVLAPDFWPAGLALLALLVALFAVDALVGAGPRSVAMACNGPGAVGVGDTLPIGVILTFAGAAPRDAEVAVGLTGPVERIGSPTGSVSWTADGRGRAEVAFRTVRRGTARVAAIWARWTGPLGLAQKQRRLPFDQPVMVTPDISALRRTSIRMLSRDAVHGLVAQMQMGEGAEFESLAIFRSGMDKRAIDWKQSARHTSLIAKEYRTERNNNIVMAIDTGRAMSEPIGGVPRVDRAVTAALLTAFVALKDGDRVGLFGFDSHPRGSANLVSGAHGFPTLQRIAAGLDYSDRETNYTLGLSTLAVGLKRRSLVVLFAEFADLISAELMLRAVAPMLKRHLILFIVFRDEELEAFTAAEPADPEDVSRAVTAAALLRERQLVLTRLRRMGVHVVETKAAEAGPSLVSAYVDMKRRNLL